MNCNSEVPAYNNSCQDLRCFYVYGTIVPITTLFGLVGNGLSIYVLLQRRMRTFIHLLLAGLCGYDCILLVASFIVYVQLAYCKCLESICALLVAILPFFFPLAQVSHTGSIYTCILIALHRTLAIRFPLQTVHGATHDKAKYALALVGVFAICLNAPAFFEIEYVPEFGLKPRAFRMDEGYRLWYKNVIHLALVYIIPFVLLLTLNAILLYYLKNVTKSGTFLVGNRNNSSRLRRHGKNFSDTRQVTLVAFFIILSFLCTNFLIVFNNFAEAAKFSMTDFQAFKTLIYVGNGLVILNSATNLLIYCAVGRRFRQIFVEKIFGLKISHSAPSTSKFDGKRTLPPLQEATHYISMDTTKDIPLVEMTNPASRDVGHEK